MTNITTIQHQVAPQPTLNSAALDSFSAFIDGSPKTVETYTKAVKKLWQYLASKGIFQPRREDIIQYREHLKAEGLKPSTVQNYIIAARLFFQWTEQAGIYPNVAAHIKGAKLDRAHKKDYLTTDQVQSILHAINGDSLKDKRDFAMLSLMITGGLRTIEVSRANIGDLRTVGNATVLYLQGKGREEKTEYVKIAAPVERAIRQYLSRRKDASNAEAPLFTSTSNNSKGERLTTRSIRATAKKRMQAAGYDSERLTAHSLRHTAVTLALLAGRDITEVQQFARHANITTTMIYNHALDKAKNECSNAISAAIF